MKRPTSLLLAACLLTVSLLAPTASRAEARAHHVAVQIDVADPSVLNMALNNVENLFAAYATRGEPVEVEVVAFGPGLLLLRDDTSPVKPRLAAAHAAHPHLVFSACENTRRGMSAAEGHEVKLVPEAVSVPAGVVRITDLEEQGWTYLRP